VHRVSNLLGDRATSVRFVNGYLEGKAVLAGEFLQLLKWGLVLAVADEDCVSQHSRRILGYGNRGFW